ncbi:probable xyloglucan endotransglucosylase/hydrolase protein 28 [Magnolia sinica]|uniref:probable xyloglucan endotransglucosylase/hydrolase protein 28 n=1 Tax=Magnolia sinica TaxID=86752 RepID=UPI00265883DE|nr:probable xyloglucan endotransglucosylase/hydrolase protein 28 [Magnolia sinica]
MLGALYFFMIFSFTSFLQATATLQNLPILSFDEGYTQLFGDSNLMLLKDGKTVHISLDERTGAGFASQDLYLHGFFSASIKLPADYTAGVVVAFYMSNGDIFEKTHDELDFEFLGNIRGKEWRIQTNVYGNGSTGLGREERYGLWFDPSEDFHKYSILWTDDQIIFYVDNIPIREIKKTKAMGSDFPSKPMSLYATIWDGSTWATSGGRYKVNYKYAPYVAEFSDLVLHGCAVDPIEQSPGCDDSHDDLNRLSNPTALISPDQRSKMAEFRKKYMTYMYCYDHVRYPTPPPECVINPREASQFQGSDGVKFGGRHRRHGKRHHRTPAAAKGREAITTL